MKIAVQINGKVRDALEFDQGVKEEEIKETALNSPAVNKWFTDKEVKKIIYLKGKLLSIVV